MHLGLRWCHKPKFKATALKCLAASTYEAVVLWNLKMLSFFSTCTGAPFQVTNGKLLLLFIDPSPYKHVFWACSLSLLILRAILVAFTFVLSMAVERFRNPKFLPVHSVMLAGSVVATVGGFSALTCHVGCFALMANSILKYKSTVRSSKLVNWFLCLFTPSVCVWGIFVSTLLAYRPELVPQFRFVVKMALDEGYLTVGPTYYTLAVATTVADFWSLQIFGAMDTTIVSFHMIFLQMWTEVMDQLSLSSSARVGHVCQRLQELLVALQVFNIGNASTVFATKVSLLFASVSAISAMILLNFGSNPILLIVMVYMSFFLPFAYPILYHRAYSVSKGLQRAKLELLAVRQYNKTDASFERRLRSISTKGVLVGSFRNFERESDLIYLGFIVSQVTSIVLTTK